MSKKKPKMRERREVINRGGKYPLILIVMMLLLIAVPTGIVIKFLYQGYIRTGTPIIGERFENDLNPSITRQQIQKITTTFKDINGVKSVDAQLQTGTLKIYTVVETEVAAEAYEPLGKQLLATVYSVLPEESYFTSSTTRRQYDLEINLYNKVEDTEKQPVVHLVVYKNAMMAEARLQFLSNAVNPDLAEKLRADELARKLAKENPQGGSVVEEDLETDVESDEEVETKASDKKKKP